MSRADLGITARDENGKHTAPIVAARSALLIAAAEARAPAIDTLWPDPRDPAELQTEIAVAACGGFAGKLCI